MDGPLLEKKEVRRKKVVSNKKRKVDAVAAEDDSEDACNGAPKSASEEPPAKVKKTESASEKPDAGSVRRSSRNAGKKVDYKAELVSEVKTLTQTNNTKEGPLGSDVGGMRKHNP